MLNRRPALGGLLALSVVVASCQFGPQPTSEPGETPAPLVSLPAGNPSPAAPSDTAAADTAAPTDRALATPRMSAAPPSGLPSPSAGTEWARPERVSTRAYGNLSLVVDEQGVAHAAAVLGDGIFYLTNSGGRWTRLRLSRAHEDGLDEEPAITIDWDGSLAVAFTRNVGWRCGEIACSPGPSEGVFVTHNRDGEWSEPRAISGRHSGGALVRARNGRLHIVYRQSHRGISTSYYATDSGGDWNRQEIAADAWHYSLEVGGDGTAHIAYLTETAGGYTHIDASAGVLVSHALPETASAWSLVLHLDGAGVPAVLYTISAGTASGTFIARLVGDSWLTSESDLAPGWAGAASTRDGELQVVYDGLLMPGEVDEDGLWYAASRSSGASYMKLDDRRPMADAPTEPLAFEVDPSGRPHVLWVVRDEGRRRDGLWYAVGPAP